MKPEPPVAPDDTPTRLHQIAENLATDYYIGTFKHTDDIHFLLAEVSRLREEQKQQIADGGTLMGKTGKDVKPTRLAEDLRVDWPNRQADSGLREELATQTEWANVERRRGEKAEADVSRLQQENARLQAENGLLKRSLGILERTISEAEGR
jgi:hypothetical protein